MNKRKERKKSVGEKKRKKKVGNEKLGKSLCGKTKKNVFVCLGGGGGHIATFSKMSL